MEVGLAFPCNPEHMGGSCAHWGTCTAWIQQVLGDGQEACQKQRGFLRCSCLDAERWMFVIRSCHMGREQAWGGWWPRKKRMWLGKRSKVEGKASGIDSTGFGVLIWQGDECCEKGGWLSSVSILRYSQQGGNSHHSANTWCRTGVISSWALHAVFTKERIQDRGLVKACVSPASTSSWKNTVKTEQF